MTASKLFNIIFYHENINMRGSSEMKIHSEEEFDGAFLLF